MIQTDLHKFFSSTESDDLKFANSMITVMEQHNNDDFAQFLGDKGLLTVEETNRIKEMIYSEDPESYEVAKAILEEKAHQVTIQKYGYNALMFIDKGVIK